MRRSGLTHQDSVKGNLKQWCFERDSEFEKFNVDSALYFEEVLRSLGRPLSVVELGCGDGAAYETFVERGIEVLGVDINEDKLSKIAGETVKSDMLEWLKSQPDNSVENIFTHHSLEHIVDIEGVLKNISRALKPRGLFYAVVPADDTVHEVHYIAFDKPSELLPPGMTKIVCEKQERWGQKELVCLAQK